MKTFASVDYLCVITKHPVYNNTLNDAAKFQHPFKQSRLLFCYEIFMSIGILENFIRYFICPLTLKTT